MNDIKFQNKWHDQTRENRLVGQDEEGNIYDVERYKQLKENGENLDENQIRQMSKVGQLLID